MVIGTAAGPFGVRGEIKVDVHTDFSDRFKRLKTVYLGPDHHEFVIVGVRRSKQRILLRLEGIDTPEAVARIRGQEIAIPRAEAMPLPEGHYYLEDAIGLRAVTTDGRELGAVSEVLRTGSNDVFIVNTGRDAILIPVIKSAISELDMQARRVTVETWVLEADT